jgi:hypothetical protein
LVDRAWALGGLLDRRRRRRMLRWRPVRSRRCGCGRPLRR